MSSSHAHSGSASLSALRAQRPLRTESGTYPVLQRRVAVVDDDALVARVTQMILAHGGHLVRVFHDPFDALQALREDPDAFDVLFTDLNMPGMRGTELIQAARALRPDLRAVLSSGCDEPPAEVSAQGLAFVSKPFSADVLLRMVHGAR
jgi:two-component system, cell cycle sensor histidine kinase and response regulator CckA